MLDSKDISVVIQGPVDHEGDDLFPLPKTFTAVRRIREQLPKSQIILSTWKGENTSYLDHIDEIVLNTDPGSQGAGKSRIPNNVNRQIVSAMGGIAKANRSHVLKIRSDVVLTSNYFIHRFEDELKRPTERFRLFKNKVISNNLSSRNPLSRDPAAYPYQPSDHVHFGHIEDVSRLWDIPLQSQDEADWFDYHDRPDNLRLNETSRLTPEQYLWTTALKANGINIVLEHYADMRPEVIEQSERYLNANFVFIQDRKYAFHFSKYHTTHHFSFEHIRRGSACDPVAKLANYLRCRTASLRHFLE